MSVSPTPPAPPPPRSSLAGRIIRLGVFVVALLAVYLIAHYWTRWEESARVQTTDDAYLQTDLTPLSARVGGYVRRVPVDDYQPVAAGQVVAEIVDDDYRALVDQAEAAVAGAEASLVNIEALRALQDATIRAAAAVIRGTEAVRERNRLEAARQEGLNKAGAGSNQALELAEANFHQLDAQLEQNKAQYDAASRQLGVLDAQKHQATASLAAARAALALARINLGYTRITAPEAGVLGQRLVRAGQYVAPGQQVNALAPLRRIWVIANFKETQLTHLRIGQSAGVVVDAFPDTRMTGHVVAYAPASGSQFALLPPDNATGNFTKVVQRIAVKIALDDAAGLGDRLRAGMSVVADIDMR